MKDFFITIIIGLALCAVYIILFFLGALVLGWIVTNVASFVS